MEMLSSRDLSEAMETSRTVRTLEVGKKNRDEALVAELMRLEKRIFPKHESLAESFSQEIQRRNGGVLYVMEDTAGSGDSSEGRGRGVAGYLMYSCTSLMAIITKLAVRENCRRQGYGETLLRAAIEKVRSRKVMCVSLHVDPLREPAFSLYKKLGFEVETLVHSYYAPQRDAYRMVLTFDSD
ncbi:hypothetical protein MPTK1_4g20560 [Marchantia polymorpha subsp. ruderalis]|uniref:N-acetyltransferase domain-containing protein n=2 Tax=Marchantia polymorpha TaxID=3197 RepID=A0AAF6BC05_MARPO|nr:hypothetical protein MARPO_0101s0002 [Marchantia polymorpha]BBN09539.1 hypothetical protein Mp_4g20560 [Marchantia polymorpha subsp. ruderalis]|eukprot:PTQ32196.1 hypothetical protein MARPO_0101s0002 [Marchantia polymorpha]